MKQGKGISGHQSAKSKTDEWLTPREVIMQMGTFDLDPCAPVNRPWPTAKNHYTIQDNGLLLPWYGRVWMNPPYSDLKTWLALMATHNNGIALTFARTDTEAFQRFVFPHADSLFFLSKRINFCNTAGMRARDDGGAPSVFIAYGEYNTEVLRGSSLVGKFVPLNYTTLIVVGISPKWISVVTIAVRQYGDKELQPVYEMVQRIAPDKCIKNRHWKAKVRQQIQEIRKKYNHANKKTN